MRLFILLAIPLAAAVPLAAQEEGPDTTEIVVVATTDVHGRAMHWDYVADEEAPWGLTRVATVIDSLRNRYRGRVVVVDGGDLIQGNPFASYFVGERPRAIHPIIDAMNAIGYDAMVVGNHDFNFGVPTMRSTLEQASFEVLGYNVFDANTGARTFRRIAIIQRGGIRVGITGLTTPGAMVWDRVNLRGALEVRPIAEVGAEMMSEFSRVGADLRIVLAHSGISGASSYRYTNIGAENAAGELALLTDRPDLVIVGHSHRVIADSVINGVHFVQPRSWARGVSVVRITLVADDGADYSVIEVDANHIDLRTTRPSGVLIRKLQRAHNDVRRWATTPIAATNGAWGVPFSQIEDTPIMDFVNEVQLRRTGAQLSAATPFNVDFEFGPESVNRGDFSGLYPYDNTLRVVRIDGAALRAYLEQSLAYLRAYEPGRPLFDESIPSYNYDVIAGLNYVVDITRPAGSRIRQMTFEGRAVTPADTFTLAVNSYRQEGGGGFDMFARLPLVYDRGENIRDLLIDAAQTIGTLNADDFFTQSWRIVPVDAAAGMREALGGTPRSSSTYLRIMATSNILGGIDPERRPWSQEPVGGMHATKRVMDSLVADCRCIDLRFDAGNALVGSALTEFTHGRATIAAFNAIGIDAAAVGLRDTRLGFDTLQAAGRTAAFQFVGANVGDENQRSWLPPWTMLLAGDHRVAIIGLARSLPDSVEQETETVTSQVAALGRTLPAIRAELPDLVVVLAGGGMDCDADGCRGNLFDVARAVDSDLVDVIIGTGTGEPIDTAINGVPVLSPGGAGRLAVFDMLNTPAGEDSAVTSVITLTASEDQTDAELEAALEPYRTEVAAILGQQITRTRAAIDPTEDVEYPLGRIVVDALQNTARTEVALIPTRHIEGGLPRGTVTYGDLFDVLPEGVGITKLIVPGSTLKEVIEWALFDGSPSAHIAGLIVRYDPERTPGQRIRNIQFPDGRSVRDNEEYSLAVPSSVHRGDDQYPMLYRFEGEDTGVSAVDALANYLRRLPAPVRTPQARRFTLD